MSYMEYWVDNFQDLASLAAHNIEFLRKQKGLTQEQLSELTKIRYPSLNRMLKNKMEFKLKHLETFASVLEVEPVMLIAFDLKNISNYSAIAEIFNNIDVPVVLDQLYAKFRETQRLFTNEIQEHRSKRTRKVG